MSNQLVYAFGPFRLIPKEHKLLCNDRPISLTPRTFDLLVVLVENSGHMLEKEELLKLVWKSTFVEEGTLTRSISTLRKVFTEENESFQYIETIPKRGYRFVVEVRSSNGKTASALENPEIHRSEGVAVSGSISDLAGQKSLEVEQPIRPWWQHRYKTAVWASVPILIGLMTLAVRHIPRSIDHFRAVASARLTDSGKVYTAALSPDGKYLAYVLFGDSEEVQMSTWIRQLATRTDLQIVPAASVLYKGIRFSPDGNFLYYVTDDLVGHSSLFQVPTFGGPPRKLLDNVISSAGVSPDGSKLAFVRQNHSLHQAELIIADADGTHDQVLATRKISGSLRSPVWSPDGKLIACISQVTDSAGPRVTVVGFETANGQEKQILPADWSMISQLAWLNDGSGLVMTAMPHGSKVSQLWMIRMPGGETQNITNDLTDYTGVSLDSSSKKLVTVQTSVISGMWVQNMQDSTLPGRQVSMGALDGFHGLSWTSSGKVVYTAGEKGEWQIWSINEDGSDRHQLTFGPGSNDAVSACRNGQYLVFLSTRSGGQHIWRTNADGTDPVQLTHGMDEESPRCSPDGQWIVYTSSLSGKPWLWKVPLRGGEPVQLTNYNAASFSSSWPAISPDGKLIAFRFVDQQKKSGGVAVISFDGGPILKTYELGYSPVRWSPDSKALAYVKTQGNVDNLWVQPLDGSPSRQITHFDALQVFNFDWSSDGKRLACARGLVNNNVLELRDSSH
jgi:Tol biopolymer transport system component/DNA-binding winged helix-turn-helix (wHTH) protein